MEVKLFEEKTEELKTKNNAEGRDWLRGLMRDVDKWSRAHDGGWRYAFQTSNMAGCFNGLLKGSRALPVTAIVAFTFYKCVEWFASREKYVRSMLEKGERLGPNQLKHLDDAKVAAIGQHCHLFDHRTGTYEVAELGGTNEAGEIRDGRKHTVVITSKTCTCGRPQQVHFPCSHMVAACRARNVSVDSMIPHDFSVQALLDTWSPRFVPFRDESEWLSYDGPKYVVDPETKWPKKGQGRGPTNNANF
jgi:hypothetical protein